MIQENNTEKNLNHLFKTFKITLNQYNFRKSANKLNIKTYQIK
jgi:hypothetical protein